METLKSGATHSQLSDLPRTYV